MISKRILPLVLAAFAVAPIAPTTAEAKDATSPKRPAHIDRIAWRNSVSKPMYVDNGRPVSRTRYITRAWHPKRTYRRLRTLECPAKKR